MAVKQKPVLRTYRVLSMPNVTDGDTLWVQREWLIGDDGEGTGEILRRDYAGGVKVRLDDGLLGLNTPEKIKDPVGWRSALDDLTAWVDDTSSNEVLLVEYGRDSWKRILGNLIPMDPEATWHSAVHYMRASGWESYK